MVNPDSGRRYEVTVLRDKRWLIDCVARTEAEAQARAEALAADESVDAVRVVRARFGQNGASYETVILERTRQAPRGEKKLLVAAGPAEAVWCETLDDLYGPAARHAAARLLRNFLDRHAITPTELLHHHRYARLLERQDALLPQALQRVAALQARTGGGDGRQRLDALDRLVQQAMARAREAVESRAAPRLGKDGLAALAEAVAAKTHAPADQAFYLRFAVSIALEGVGGFGEKMAQLMGWVAAGLPPPLLPLIDELAAGLFGAVSFIQDTLAAQSNLASALSVLADVAVGSCADSLPPALAPLGDILQATGMPETRSVLLERLQRELAGDKPLSRDDRPVQRRLFEGLLEKLVDERGLIAGGGAMLAAVARRSRLYEIVGGVEEVRFAAPDAPARLDQLLSLAAGVNSERQERALATYMVEILDGFAGDPAPLLGLRPRLDAARLPDPAKAAILASWPVPVVPTRAAG